MATNNEREFLGRDGTEQLVATVKALLNDKQDKLAFTAKVIDGVMIVTADNAE